MPGRRCLQKSRGGTMSWSSTSVRRRHTRVMKSCIRRSPYAISLNLQTAMWPLRRSERRFSVVRKSSRGSSSCLMRRSSPAVACPDGARHHVIGWEEDLVWHSVRWYVSSGAEIVELTLTAEAGADLEIWGGQCDRMIRNVVCQGAPEPASNLCWPEVPADVRAQDSWEVVTEQGLNPPWLESLRAGYDAVQEQDPWSAWAREPSLEQRRVLEQELPILSGVGERSGQGFRIEACLDGRGGAVVVVVPEGEGDGTNVRRGVRTVPVSLVVPVLLTWAGLRADWLRDEVMEAPGDVAPTEMAELWRGRRGADGVGSEASADWWRWWNQEGEVVAEWVQPLHRAPLAVFRDESRCVGVPVMPGVLYSVLQATVQEIAGSPHT